MRRNSIIEQMESIINRFDKKYALFSGGCCYSAYVLAKNLEKVGIKYKVIVVQCEDVLYEKDFFNAVNGDGAMHVGVEVVYKKKRVIIGKWDRIKNCLDEIGYKYTVGKYTGITPDDLLKSYRCNIWNEMYDRKYNGPLMRAINKICNV